MATEPMTQWTLPPLAHVTLDVARPDAPPRLPYYRLARRDDGLSGLSVGALDAFRARSVGGQAAPMWMLDFPGEIQNLNISILPVGWTGDWHESPWPQWVIPLSGSWFIEAQDGSRVEMGPGDIHWGEDIGTRASHGGRGHRSGQVGDEPCVIMMVQFKDTSKASAD